MGALKGGCLIWFCFALTWLLKQVGALSTDYSMISADGDVEERIVVRIRCGWKKFRDFLPFDSFLKLPQNQTPKTVNPKFLFLYRLPSIFHQPEDRSRHITNICNSQLT